MQLVTETEQLKHGEVQAVHTLLRAIIVFGQADMHVKLYRLLFVQLVQFEGVMEQVAQSPTHATATPLTLTYPLGVGLTQSPAKKTYPELHLSQYVALIQ